MGEGDTAINGDYLIGHIVTPSPARFAGDLSPPGRGEARVMIVSEFTNRIP